jgi:Coenzyme PQQ synthesis protein D (PqqD)
MTTITPNLRSVVTPDGAMVLDITRNVMVPLNSMGGYIWNKLHEGSSADEIVRELVREADVDAATIESEVHTFLEQLATMHLVTPSGL